MSSSHREARAEENLTVQAKAETAIEALISGIVGRLRSEPDLDDFLLWRAGTLEYWIHVVASSVGQRLGVASRTEVPYITGLPATTSKSNTKWADGAVLLEDSIGVLVEVKTIATSSGVVGPTLRKVPADMCALASADWPATLAQPPDGYAGEAWVELRSRMREVHGIQLAFVHGYEATSSLDSHIQSAMKAGFQSIRYRLRAQQVPTWLPTMESRALNSVSQAEIVGSRERGLLLAWTFPIFDGSATAPPGTI